jgi:hypothetical protein
VSLDRGAARDATTPESLGRARAAGPAYGAPPAKDAVSTAACAVNVATTRTIDRRSVPFAPRLE